MSPNYKEKENEELRKKKIFFYTSHIVVLGF